MLAPSPSFKSAIALCRQNIATDAVIFGIDPKLAREILGRWERHGAVEKIWNDIREKLRGGGWDMGPGWFIGVVLKERGIAEKISHGLQKWPDVEAQKRARIKRAMLDKDYGAMADEAIWLDDTTASMEFLSQKKATAHQQHFMVFLVTVFEDLCGQPFYWIVAALTGIAFDVVVTEEQARDAARRKDRDILPPK